MDRLRGCEGKKRNNQKHLPGAGKKTRTTWTTEKGKNEMGPRQLPRKKKKRYEGNEDGAAKAPGLRSSLASEKNVRRAEKKGVAKLLRLWINEGKKSESKERTKGGSTQKK